MILCYRGRYLNPSSHLESGLLEQSRRIEQKMQQDFNTALKNHLNGGVAKIKIKNNAGAERLDSRARTAYFAVGISRKLVGDNYISG